VYGVGTLPAARGRGVGGAITLWPLVEARARGYRYAVLFATEMGHPVYRRLGFRDVGSMIGRYLWWGAAGAAGAYVWAHDLSAGFDSRGQQPPPQLRWFNNAGFDVMRFDRHPNGDAPDRAAGWLRESLLALRAAGYRLLVVGGQGRGGWNALMMLAEPGLTDAVVAMAPTRHGDGALADPNDPRPAQDFQELLAQVADRRARVVIAAFAGDAALPDPAAQSARVSALLVPRAAAVLSIDRPYGFEGHGVGRTWRFSDAYGGCIFRFVTAAAPPAGC